VRIFRPRAPATRAESTLGQSQFRSEVSPLLDTPHMVRTTSQAASDLVVANALGPEIKHPILHRTMPMGVNHRLGPRNTRPRNDPLNVRLATLESASDLGSPHTLGLQRQNPAFDRT